MFFYLCYLSVCVFFFFLNDTATTEINTRSPVGSVRCLKETDRTRHDRTATGQRDNSRTRCRAFPARATARHTATPADRTERTPAADDRWPGGSYRRARDGTRPATRRARTRSSQRASAAERIINHCSGGNAPAVIVARLGMAHAPFVMIVSCPTPLEPLGRAQTIVARPRLVRDRIRPRARSTATAT